MRIMRRVLTIAACLLAGSRVAASQQLQARPVPTELVESFFYQSPSMGERYVMKGQIKPGHTDAMGTTVARGLRTLYGKQ